MVNLAERHPKVTVGDLRIGNRERVLINKVLDSNRLSYGPMTRELESKFAKLHDSKYAVFCNSGTSALHIAVQACKELYRWKDGDEVLVPAVTFVATPNVVLHNRLAVKFVDVDPLTYNIDVEKMYQAIGPQTKAVMPVHLMGLPCDMPAIRDCGLTVIEDSCETMFARYKGKSVGSFGEIGCFSTYIAHYIVTGVGGFCTTQSEGVASVLRSLMNHGRDPAYLSIDDDDLEGQGLKEIVSKRLRFVRHGHSFRATELEAALGLGQLEDWKEIRAKREENAAYLTAHLREYEDQIQLPTVLDDRDHVFMLYPIVMKHESKKWLIEKLEAAGIETRDLMPLCTQPIYAEQMRGKYPVAEQIADKGFYIGCHQYLTRKQLDHVVRTISDYFDA